MEGTPDAEIRPGDDRWSVTRTLADAAWLTARAERAARFHAHRACPTRVAPYGNRDPNARTVHPMCNNAGCLDLHHELITRVMRKLQAHPDRSRIHDLGAYAYRVAGTELVELKRAERTAVGFPAKPGRSDGAAGRVEASLKASEADGAWLRTLFGILRSYPFSLGHVSGRWPVEGLATERGRHFPQEADQVSAVRRDIARVMARAADVVGHQWVYDNLTLPLQAGGRPSALLEEVHATDADDGVHALMGRMLLEAYQRERATGLGQREALALAAYEVTGHIAPPHSRDVMQALRELDDAAATSTTRAPVRPIRLSA